MTVSAGVVACAGLLAQFAQGGGSPFGNVHGVCTFDPASRTLAVTSDSEEPVDDLHISRDEDEPRRIVLHEHGIPSHAHFGPGPERDLECAVTGTGERFVPTVDNVDGILVVETRGLRIDLSGGPLAPELRFESVPGISSRGLIVSGTTGDGLRLRIGASGFGSALDLDAPADGSAGDIDVLAYDVNAIGVWGSQGDDVIDASGGAGFDGPLASELSVQGNAGNDALTGGLGRSSLMGDDGDDTIAAGPGGGTLTGLAGADTIVGSPRSDFLSDGPGADFVSAGERDDVLTSGGGDDALDAGLGTDILSFSSCCHRKPVAVDLRVHGPQETRAAGADTYLGFENLDGGDGPDRLIGDAGANRIRGGAGRDRITGGAGADALAGGEEVDILVARDRERDIRLACGPPGATEIARRDRVDPRPVSCG